MTSALNMVLLAFVAMNAVALVRLWRFNVKAKNALSHFKGDQGMLVMMDGLADQDGWELLMDDDNRTGCLVLGRDLMEKLETQDAWIAMGKELDGRLDGKEIQFTISIESEGGVSDPIAAAKILKDQRESGEGDEWKGSA